MKYSHRYIYIAGHCSSSEVCNDQIFMLFASTVFTMATSTNFKSFFSVVFCIFSILSGSTDASVITRRAVINHDAVVGFPQTIPNTTQGMAYLRYKPWLDVPHGCVPFPAVDALGNTGFVDSSRVLNVATDMCL